MFADNSQYILKGAIIIRNPQLELRMFPNNVLSDLIEIRMNRCSKCYLYCHMNHYTIDNIYYFVSLIYNYLNKKIEDKAYVLCVSNHCLVVSIHRELPSDI